MITSAFFNFLLQALLSALCLNLTLDRMYSFNLQMKNGKNYKNQNGKRKVYCLSLFWYCVVHCGDIWGQYKMFLRDIVFILRETFSIDDKLTCYRTQTRFNMGRSTQGKHNVKKRVVRLSLWDTIVKYLQYYIASFLAWWRIMTIMIHFVFKVHFW